MDQKSNLPSLRFKEEPELLLLSTLLKALNPHWGNLNSQVSKMVLDYFKFIPLNPAYFETIRQFQQAGLTEATLYQLALTYNHPERSEFVLNYLTKQTNLPLEQLHTHQDALLKTLASFKLAVTNSPLRQLFNSYNAKDTHQRLENMEQLKSELAEVYRFFRLKLKQTELLLTPSDPLFSEYLGHSLELSDNQLVLMTHNPQVKTQIYQIMRSLLRPSVEKIIAKLSDQQQQAIYQSTSGKNQQFYGPNPADILLAELISVFYNNVRNHRAIEDFESFQARIRKLSDKEFLQSLEANSALRQRCAYMGIHNLVELKANLRAYFDMFFRDELSTKIYRAYQFYQNQHPNIDFEQFALNNLPKML